MNSFRGFFLQHERILKATMHVVSAIAYLLAAAVEFGFIESLILKIVIFVVLGFSILVNLLLSINTNIYPSKRLATGVINTFLDNACRNIDQGDPNEFRSCVFIPASKSGDLLEIEYRSSNMVGASDEHIVFKIFQGLVGNVWAFKAPMWADLTLPTVEGGAPWGMTVEQIEMTKGIKSVYGHPIRHPQDTNDVIGVLSFDTQSPPDDFPNNNPHYSTHVASTAAIIGQFLLDFGQILPKKDKNDNN